SITAIAASVGFENSLYFSKVFKRLKGMTPTEYREN
ncbi:MAG: AraC family transcriptional regulator, partial [Catenibacillus sp.]|nr:AraC family transcriptional regulator [Catenibacillus sp.]